MDAYPSPLRSIEKHRSSSKFPDRVGHFPVRSQKFTVLVSREFGPNCSKSLAFADHVMREAASKSKYSLFFSLLAWNFNVETGSTATAAATTCNFCA
jgi:hypothetical protein